MPEFALAFAVFLAAHVLPAATGLRAAAVARVGRGRWVLGYSLLSIALLAWLISAALRAPYVELWAPSRPLALVALAVMPLACMLLAAGAARANPVSVSFRGGPVDAARPGVLALTRHPILWAFALWGGAHALANGDLVSVTLFGGFALFALVGMRGLERRARRRGETAGFAPARGPLGARLRRAASPRLAAEAALGLALYALLLALHGPALGVAPTAWI
ncbi:NnrU family protein [Albimonas sp. CAU 1670]|uniref:NnrU family protein n=1 Tax=Albimonas sp. CAU 1670 TaxID=3032599 RepID=UPI0023D99E06|nr:NnrU family protein [Albimonas sp. CAU 1670]MDF2233828.1 NnrU family protein [Albimonas sp. CAU 1670]